MACNCNRYFSQTQNTETQTHDHRKQMWKTIKHKNHINNSHFQFQKPIYFLLFNFTFSDSPLAPKLQASSLTIIITTNNGSSKLHLSDLYSHTHISRLSQLHLCQTQGRPRSSSPRRSLSNGPLGWLQVTTLAHPPLPSSESTGKARKKTPWTKYP